MYTLCSPVRVRILHTICFAVCNRWLYLRPPQYVTLCLGSSQVTKKLGGENYVFWGGREGYQTLLTTDLKKELDHMVRKPCYICLSLVLSLSKR